MFTGIIIGAVATVALYTFAPPAIAALPSKWLRDVIAWGSDLLDRKAK